MSNQSIIRLYSNKKNIQNKELSNNKINNINKTLKSNYLNKENITNKTDLINEFNMFDVITNKQDSIKTLIRLKPFQSFDNTNCIENSSKLKIKYNIINNQSLSLENQITNENHNFVFDYVSNEDSNQNEIYSNSAKILNNEFVNGYNCTLFTYGTTGSGKTYTLFGNYLKGINGIIELTLLDIIETLNNLDNDKSNQFLRNNPINNIYRYNSNYELHFCFIEIYKEKIIDLLEISKDSRSNNFNNYNLKEKLININSKEITIRENKNGNITLDNINKVKINSLREFSELLKQGVKKRHCLSTMANKDSSRSHALVTIYLSRKDNNKVINSTFCFVDLAGSEKQKITNTDGDAVKEGGLINKSLMNFELVIKQLESKSSFVPYRHSKLTYILKNSLGGNSKTYFIANICLKLGNYKESLSTLLFAEKLSKIINNISINAVRSLSLENENYVLKEENRLIKSHLNILKNELNKSGNCKDFYNNIMQEKSYIKTKEKKLKLSNCINNNLKLIASNSKNLDEKNNNLDSNNFNTLFCSTSVLSSDNITELSEKFNKLYTEYNNLEIKNKNLFIVNTKINCEMQLLKVEYKNLLSKLEAYENNNNNNSKYNLLDKYTIKDCCLKNSINICADNNKRLKENIEGLLKLNTELQLENGSKENIISEKLDYIKLLEDENKQLLEKINKLSEEKNKLYNINLEKDNIFEIHKNNNKENKDKDIYIISKLKEAIIFLENKTNTLINKLDSETNNNLKLKMKITDLESNNKKLINKFKLISNEYSKILFDYEDSKEIELILSNKVNKLIVENNKLKSDYDFLNLNIDDKKTNIEYYKSIKKEMKNLKNENVNLKSTNENLERFVKQMRIINHNNITITNNEYKNNTSKSSNRKKYAHSNNKDNKLKKSNNLTYETNLSPNVKLTTLPLSNSTTHLPQNLIGNGYININTSIKSLDIIKENENLKNDIKYLRNTIEKAINDISLVFNNENINNNENNINLVFNNLKLEERFVHYICKIIRLIKYKNKKLHELNLLDHDLISDKILNINKNNDNNYSILKLDNLKKCSNCNFEQINLGNKRSLPTKLLKVNNYENLINSIFFEFSNNN